MSYNRSAVKFNWNQTGMPATLVSRLGRGNELAAIKTVLHDAGSRVMRSVDAEVLARELLESGSEDLVELVRDLTASLAHMEKELEAANRRCAQRAQKPVRKRAKKTPNKPPEPPANAEWAEWDRKFQSLLA